MTALFAIALFAMHAAQPATMAVQYDAGFMGKAVTVRTEEGITKTFAGKLAFHSQNSSWCSVCADIHHHIANGDAFVAELLDSGKADRGLLKAGNIVAKFFNQARTPEQCAGLQLAVWEAIEDNGDAPDFFNGRFAVMGDPLTLSYANQYYGAAGTMGSAVFLHASDNRSQSQLSSRF